MRSCTSLLWIVALGFLGVVRPPAAAALPDEIKAQQAVTGAPADVAVSADGRVGVVTSPGGGKLTVFDLADPASAGVAVSACTAPQAVTFDATTEAFLVACADGQLQRFVVDDSSLPAGLTALTAIQFADDPELVDVVSAGGVAYAATADGWLVAAELGSSSEITEAPFPVELGAGGALPAALAVADDGITVLVAMQDHRLIEVGLGEGVATTAEVDSGEEALVDVIGGDWFVALSAAGVLLGYEAGAGAVTAWATLDAGDGLAAFDDGGSPLIAVVGDGTVSYVDATGATVGEAAVLDGAAAIAVTDDGYALVADPDTEMVQLLGGNPWVRITGLAPAEIAATDDVTLTLTSDTDGALTLRVGGDIAGSGTALTADVDALTAEVEAAVVFSASELADGANTVFAFVEDAGGATGRAAIEVTVGDDVIVSDVPAPGGYSATPGNAKVLLQWGALDETGVVVDHYVVYFDTAEFDPADGDPGYCEDDDETLCSGLEVPVAGSSTQDAAAWADDDDTTGDDDDTTGDDDDTTGDDDDDTTEDDGTVSVTLSPLTNGTTYYLAVAAVTTDGALGAFTEVVAAMPQATGGAAWLAGDEGGYGCGDCDAAGAAGRGPGLLALLALAVMWRRAAARRGEER